MTSVYLFPLFQGLILLPLDLLISQYAPWASPYTILLKNPYMQDSVVQLFPWRHFVFESLTSGMIPLWNPYQFLGGPFMASIKPLVFYPLNIFFVFGEIPAWHLLLGGQIFLSLLFAYLLARDFKFSVLVSIFVACAFSFNSFMIALLEFGSDAHTMVWWPLILLFGKRYLDTTNRKHLFFLGISIALSFLGGQLQYLGYFLISFAFFLLFYGLFLKRKLQHFLFLFVSIVLGFGLIGLQLLPSIELFSYSHRGLLTQAQQQEVFQSGLLAPQHLFRLFAPDFFGNPVSRDESIGYIEGSGYFGVIALFFAMFAIVFSRRQFIVKLFAGLFIGSLLLSLRGIGEILSLLHVPIITSGDGGRIFTIVLFFGAFLAGFGLQEFLQMKERKKQLLSMISFVLLFGIIVTVSFLMHLFASVEALVRSLKFAVLIIGAFGASTIIYLFLLQRKKYARFIQVGFLLVIICLSFFDFFRFGYRFLTFSNEKFLYPEIPVTRYLHDATASTLGRVYGLTEPELGTYVGLQTIEVYNPLFLLRTGELLQSLQQLPPHELSSGNKYFLSTKKEVLKYSLDVLGVEYIVVSKDVNPALSYFDDTRVQSALTKVYGDEQFAVYRNGTSYPRFALLYEYEVVSDEKTVLKKIADRDGDLRKMVYLEKALPLTLTPGSGSAQLTSWTPNTLAFSVQTDKPALLYLSDAWYPGWKATVNDTPAEIYRANYALRAVVVPEGNSSLQFVYEPDSFRYGLIVSGVSALLLLFFAFFSKRSGHKTLAK